MRETLAVPEGRAAGHRRLAAVESHLRRQPQFGLTLYNGGSMYLDAGKPMPGGIEETVRNLREISPTVYFNVPKGYRIAAALSARRQGVARKILRPAARDVLLRRGAVAVRLEQPRRTRGAGNRLPCADADRARRHRDRAVLHVGQSAHQPLRPYRASGVRQRRQAGSQQWQAGSSRQGAERHAGLLASAGTDRERPSTRRASTNSAMRSSRPIRTISTPASISMAALPRISNSPAAPGSASARLRARFIAACAPLVRDVVIAGINRDEISAMVVLDLDGCRLINPTMPLDDLSPRRPIR